MNAKPLTMLEVIADIRQMIERAYSVSELPIVRVPSKPRYFKHVKGRRSASLRARSRRRKLSR